MEDERQRLIVSDNSDGAAEIAGLLAWKLKGLKIVGGKEGKESTSNDTSHEEVLQKFRYACALYPDYVEGNLTFGATLLETGNVKDEILHLE